MDRTKTRYFTTKVGAGSLHKKPSFFSDCISETVYGDSNKILKYHKEWVFIECEDGYKGWINKFYGLVTEKKIILNILLSIHVIMDYLIQIFHLVQKWEKKLKALSQYQKS